METKTLTKKVKDSKENLRTTVKLSIRRKPGTSGLPGQDSTVTIQKIGSSIGLRALDFDEEERYLPELINVNSSEPEFRRACKEYWNNISEPIPADGVNANLVATTSTVYGKPLEFVVQFEEEKYAKLLANTSDFKKKAAIISKQGNVIDGVADYVLFRHCLVYGRVANSVKDLNKSAKIKFYLYSKTAERDAKYSLFKATRKANTLFDQMLTNESLIDAILIRFKMPLETYPSLEDKHLALNTLANTKSTEFIKYAEDKQIQEKAMVLQAAAFGIIHNPPNTEAYYFGDNNEVLLGKTLIDAVLYFRSKEQRNVQIKEAVEARLKEFDNK